MTRYVDKPHGLVISSDNWFFINDNPPSAFEINVPQHVTDSFVLPDGVESFRDGYRSSVWTRGYRFDQINSLNCWVRTPAQQLMWREETLDYEYEWRDMQLPSTLKWWVPSNWLTRWLNDNVGERFVDWDTYHWARKVDSALFFKKRKDALALTRELARHLDHRGYGY